MNLIVPESLDDALKNVLGPTSMEIGEDIKTLYKTGRDLILRKGLSKIEDINDGQMANLRVARDVFWNGSFSNEAICAEYFGGILAASRSADGKNDSGVFYVDIIKSLSSGQLKMHYIIYRCLNRALLTNEEKRTINPGQENQVSREGIFIPLLEILDQLNPEDVGAVLHGLSAKKLIGTFQTDNQKLEGEKTLPYLKVYPTSLGVQLFAIANNKFKDWRNFSIQDFGDFDEIKLPEFCEQSMDALLEKVGVKKENA